MLEIIVDGIPYGTLEQPYLIADGRVWVPTSDQPIELPLESELLPDRWDIALRVLEPNNPTGAWGMSDTTARSQVSMPGGRDASKRIVEINLERDVPSTYWTDVQAVAQIYELPAEFVCAVFCRESHHGAALDSRGEGDRGYAFGVGQIDKRYWDQQGRPDPYSIEHMQQCCEIMKEYLGLIERKHPNWADKYILKGCAVAYNSGVGNVVTIEGMDRGTTGNDYGADVMARAQFYIDLMPG